MSYLAGKQIGGTNEVSKKTSLRQLIFSFGFLVIYGVIPIAVSGDWRWREGWIFSLSFCLLSLGTVVYLYIKDPALLNERFGSPVQKDQKPWDKILLILFFVCYLIWYVIMPLDARRFGWSPQFPNALKLLGLFLYLAGFYFLFGALKENTFAAPVVKMQKERGQKVISTGLYSLVRHPMYSGGTMLFLGAPLFLNSIYGEVISLLLVLMLAGRILGEEEMLKQELEGYEDYMSRVRWRMVPFLY